MIYNFNWIIFLPPPFSFLRTQRRPVRSQLCYDRFGLLWRLVTPYKWLYSRGNLCVCVIWTYYCCWPRLCSVSQLEKYVYSVLDGVKLCKPRSTLDELFISIVYGAELPVCSCVGDLDSPAAESKTCFHLSLLAPVNLFLFLHPEHVKFVHLLLSRLNSWWHLTCTSAWLSWNTRFRNVMIRWLRRPLREPCLVLI